MKTSRENMASALISLGYEVNRQWFFNLRDEKTPSAKINMDGSVHDFGSGWHGDLIQLLIEYKSMEFKTAKNEAQRLLGEEISIDFTKFEKSSSEKKSGPLPEKFMVPHRIDARNSKQAYLHELKELFLGSYKGEEIIAAPWKNILELAKKYDIGFNKKSGRLIMPIKDIGGGIQTFWKYKKRGADFVREDGSIAKHRKVLYTKGRERPLFAIEDLKLFREKHSEESILITEGEKDAMVAMANGQHAICIGGAGASKKLKEEYLNLFRGLKVIIAGDFDRAGVEFNNNLYEQLEPIAKSVTLLDWRAKAKKDGFELVQKFDLADYFAWKNMPKKKKVVLTIQQISTVKVEVEVENEDEIKDMDLSSLFDDGELLDISTEIYNKEIK